MNRLRDLISGFLVSAAITGTALAAETAEHGEEASGGMPQLDPSTFGSQIFWLAVTFGALFFIMSKKVLPAVEEVMAERNRRIQGDLDAATKLRTEAEEAYSSYEKQLQSATSGAQSLVASAKDRASGEIAERATKLEAELEASIIDATSEVSNSAKQALAGIEDVAAEAAVAAVERLIGVKVSMDEAKNALAAVK